jgi:hypothetical protein
VRPQRSFVATQQSRASCCLASAPTASVVVGPLASMEPTVAAPAAPPLSFATPPSTPLRPRVVERACAEPHRVSPRRRSRWETGGRAAGHPSRRRAPRRPPYGRHTKPSCGGGGMAAAIAVAPTAHRWWRGGRLGCRLVSSEKLDVGSGTPTEERGCGPWRIDQEVSVSAHDGKPSGGAPRHKEGWCWPSSAAACSPEPGARTNDSKGIEWVLSTSPPATWWRGT